MNFLTQLSENFTIQNIILIILGMVIYFLGFFKSQNPNITFSIRYWLKDNWYNIPITLCAVIAFFILKENVSNIEAFAIGLSPNLVLDWLVDFNYNRKLKTKK